VFFVLIMQLTASAHFLLDCVLSGMVISPNLLESIKNLLSLQEDCRHKAIQLIFSP